MTAEELADEEWGVVKEKGKKAKKAKGKKAQLGDDEEGSKPGTYVSIPIRNWTDLKLKPLSRDRSRDSSRGCSSCAFTRARGSRRRRRRR